MVLEERQSQLGTQLHARSGGWHPQLPSSGATMQLENAAEGHEHTMSSVHPVWSASSSNVSDFRSHVDAYSRVKHWWPSHAFHCTFCTRVFRTAQALGGHMNIHRRERACANDVGTFDHIGSTTSTFSEPSPSPVSNMVEPGLPLFGASHRLLMTRTAPNSMAEASSMSYMENCNASRRLPSLPPASTYNVSTHLQISANLAPVPADVTTYLTDQGAPRPCCNGGHGKLKVTPSTSEPQPRFVNNNNISDPLTWLFSQLPPPGSALTSQSACRTNILTQRNLTKPYHRALAVSKSAPGVRRHVCRIHASPFAAQNVLYTGLMQSRSRNLGVEYGESSSSAAQQASRVPEESLDLELRL